MNLNSPSVTVIGFDYGTKRIGVAVGQSVTGTATPLATIPARDGIPNWQQIGDLLKEWQPNALVVGIPYNMDESESEMSVRAKKFARRLNGRFNLPAHGVDERLTSREARDRMETLSMQGVKQKQGLDSFAAVVIVESWFFAQQQ
ncbi:MAG: Holliday junction resolvase RuvX [Pseudomonadales bacterium]|nr:Holliday junction resolvase RuvX [Pseudomonadales bacterium]